MINLIVKKYKLIKKKDLKKRNFMSKIKMKILKNLFKRKKIKNKNKNILIKFKKVLRKKQRIMKKNFLWMIINNLSNKQIIKNKVFILFQLKKKRQNSCNLLNNNLKK